jgi:hypothetical protein
MSHFTASSRRGTKLPAWAIVGEGELVREVLATPETLLERAERGLQDL